MGTVSPWQMAGGFCTLLNPASDLHRQHLVDLETSASRSRGSPVEALRAIPPPAGPRCDVVISNFQKTSFLMVFTFQ